MPSPTVIVVIDSGGAEVEHPADPIVTPQARPQARPQEPSHSERSSGKSPPPPHTTATTTTTDPVPPASPLSDTSTTCAFVSAAAIVDASLELSLTDATKYTKPTSSMWNDTDNGTPEQAAARHIGTNHALSNHNNNAVIVPGGVPRYTAGAAAAAYQTTTHANAMHHSMRQTILQNQTANNRVVVPPPPAGMPLVPPMGFGVPQHFSTQQDQQDLHRTHSPGPAPQKPKKPPPATTMTTTTPTSSSLLKNKRSKQFSSSKKRTTTVAGERRDMSTRIATNKAIAASAKVSVAGAKADQKKKRLDKKAALWAQKALYQSKQEALSSGTPRGATKTKASQPQASLRDTTAPRDRRARSSTSPQPPQTHTPAPHHPAFAPPPSSPGGGAGYGLSWPVGHPLHGSPRFNWPSSMAGPNMDSQQQQQQQHHHHYHHHSQQYPPHAQPPFEGNAFSLTDGHAAMDHSNNKNIESHNMQRTPHHAHQQQQQHPVDGYSESSWQQTGWGGSGNSRQQQQQQQQGHHPQTTRMSKEVEHTSRRDNAEQQWRRQQQQKQKQQQSSASSAGPSKQVERRIDLTRERHRPTKKRHGRSSFPHEKENSGQPPEQSPAQEEGKQGEEGTASKSSGDGTPGSEAANGQKSMPRQTELGLVRPCALEEKVARAASLVAAELRSGAWVCSSFEPDSQSPTTNLGAIQRTNQTQKGNHTSPHTDHRGGIPATTTTTPPSIHDVLSQEDIETMTYAAATAMEQFAMDVIFPSLVSAGVGEGDDCEDGSAESIHLPKGQRPFLATCLALREVLASNAESFFFLQPDLPESNQMALSTMPGQARKRKRSQEEETAYKAQLMATGLILSALRRLPRGQSHPLTAEFLRLVHQYDTGADEFASSLERADGRTMGVLPTGRALSPEENVAWRVSFNRARETHPVLIRKEHRTIYARAAALTAGQPNMVPDTLPNSIAIPEPNACAVYIVEQLPISTLKKLDQRREAERFLRKKKVLLQERRERLAQTRLARRQRKSRPHMTTK